MNTKILDIFYRIKDIEKVSLPSHYPKKNYQSLIITKRFIEVLDFFIDKDIIQVPISI